MSIKAKFWLISGLLSLILAIVLVVFLVQRSGFSRSQIESDSLSIEETEQNTTSTKSFNSQQERALVSNPDVSNLKQLLREFGQGDLDLFDLLSHLKTLNAQASFKLIEETYFEIGNAMLVDILVPILVIHSAEQIGYDAVFKKVSELDESIQITVFSYVLRGWAAKRPHAALEAASALASTGFFKNLETDILKIWAETNFSDFVENIDTLPVTLRAIGQQVRLTTLANTSPEDASKLIKWFAGTIYDSELARAIARSWTEQDSEAALFWIENTQDLRPHVRYAAAVEALRTLARLNPQVAMERAFEISEHPMIGDVLVDVFEVVAMYDLEYAQKLLSQLNHVSTHIIVGRELVRNKQWDEVLTLMDSVTDDSRSEYHEYIFQYWAMENPAELLKAIGVLEPDAATHAALQLLLQNRVYYFLSSDEVSYLSEMLSLTHSKQLKDTEKHPTHSSIVIQDDLGFSRTYTMNEVLSALYRDIDKQVDSLPFRLKK